MKRNHGHVSQTPAALLKRGKTSSRMDGPLGTPVEGLTSKPVSSWKGLQVLGVPVCCLWHPALTVSHNAPAAVD